MIWNNILLGSLLTTITIFIHSAATRYIVYLVNKRSVKQRKWKYSKEYSTAIIVFILLMTSVSEAGIWALSYMLVHAIPVFEHALYFSIVTFTTLGYGDITLSEKWRLLASFEAAIGIIIFGWSTAIVFVVVQKLFFKK